MTSKLLGTELLMWGENFEDLIGSAGAAVSELYDKARADAKDHARLRNQYFQEVAYSASFF